MAKLYAKGRTKNDSTHYFYIVIIEAATKALKIERNSGRSKLNISRRTRGVRYPYSGTASAINNR